MAIACEEESSPEPEQESIVGLWQLESVDQSNCNDSSEDGFTALVCSLNSCVTFEFEEDGGFEGVYVEDGVTETVRGTYTTTDNGYTINTIQENVTGKFTVLNNILTMDSTDPDSGCDVEAVFRKQ